MSAKAAPRAAGPRAKVSHNGDEPCLDVIASTVTSAP